MKELGQAPCKLGVFRNDADLPGIEGIAVEQHAVGLRARAQQTRCTGTRHNSLFT